MARIQGVSKADAGPMVRLIYRFGPRMMKKLTGRAAQTGSGLEPMELWAHQPKMMMAMGKFNQAIRKGKSVDERIKNLARAQGCADDRLRVLRRPRVADLPQLRLV